MPSVSRRATRPDRVPGSPEFFVDRSLGRKQVPALLRDAGWDLRTLAEVYGVPRDETVEDPGWLELAGERGWAVLMKDDKIRYRKAELGALIAGNVRAFCLTGGNLRADEMAARFLRHQAEIWKACAEPGPFVFVVSVREVRRIDV